MLRSARMELWSQRFHEIGVSGYLTPEGIRKRVPFSIGEISLDMLHAQQFTSQCPGAGAEVCSAPDERIASLIWSWAPGQPVDAAYGGGHPEDCALLNGNLGRWESRNGSESHYLRVLASVESSLRNCRTVWDETGKLLKRRGRGGRGLTRVRNSIVSFEATGSTRIVMERWMKKTRATMCSEHRSTVGKTNDLKTRWRNSENSQDMQERMSGWLCTTHWSRASGGSVAPFPMDGDVPPPSSSTVWKRLPRWE